MSGRRFLIMLYSAKKWLVSAGSPFPTIAVQAAHRVRTDNKRHILMANGTGFVLGDIASFPKG
jgi:hypothetical protein